MTVCTIEFNGCLGDGTGQVCPYVWKFKPTGQYHCAYLNKELNEMPDKECPFQKS